MASSPSPERKGTVLGGRYLILRKLGSGSLGTVYLARDDQTRGEVAVKILRPDRATSRAIGRFQEEFKTFASLRHPLIATAFDFGYSDDGRVPYYTREYIRGTPLPPGPPSGAGPAEHLRPIVDLLDALEYLHSSGLLHLDIHAGNLIVSETPDRGSVLIDFGLMRSFGDAAQSSSLPFGFAVPPEVLLSGKAGPAADLYLAGRLLLFRLTGRADGDGKLPSEIPGWGPRITLDLERIGAKALQPDPAQRFSSARELREALLRVLGEGTAAARETGPVETTVGRAAELASIEEALREIGDHRSTLLRFLGPSGVGKTRLLDEARLRGQLRGFEVVEARFASGSGSAPRLLDALRSSRALGRTGLEWLEPLAREFGGAPAERASRAAKAYFSEPGKSLVLLIDDFDHSDDESRTLLNALVEEGLDRPQERSPRALCVIISATQASRADRARGRTIELKPLAIPEADSLLRNLLRPLAPPPALLRRAVFRSRRLPLRLRQIALALRGEWRETGSIPPSATLPEFVSFGANREIPGWAANDPLHALLLRSLAVLRRPVRGDEIAAAALLDARGVRRGLRRLVESELVESSRSTEGVSYWIKSPDVAESLRAGVSRTAFRQMHASCARHLRRASRPGPRSLAHLALHLLSSGAPREGRALALDAARALRGSGQLQHALEILKEASATEPLPSRKLELAEAASGILEETGSHAEGVALLEPFHAALGTFRRTRRIRILRLLGVHCHRAGLPDRALAAFEHLRRIADPAQHAEDLLFVDSELGELYTYQSRFAEAEEACLRGLERLKGLSGRTDLARHMEIVLRASLGHLELRRMALPRARAELRAAIALASARPGGESTGASFAALEAVILNNLGIAERQLNRFGASRACFHRAEKLLGRAGEGRSLIKIACNLALMAAHEADAAGTRSEIERASQLLKRYPGQRLEFFVSYTKGVVAGLLGDAAEASARLEESLPVGRALGDSHLVPFGEALLAESNLVCGRYSRALEQLRKTERECKGGGAPLLRRMLAARSLLLASLLGDRRARRAPEQALSKFPRTDAELPEAWNDVILGLARLLAGELEPELLKPARRLFRRIRSPAGERLIDALLLAHALDQRQSDRIETLARALGDRPPIPEHRLLSVIEPLLLAEARFALGDVDGAESALSRASGAMVGLPCLELDLRIELLRGRLALRHSDQQGARRHVQRSLHTRELLAELAPAAHRKAFASHSRFQGLARIGARVDAMARVVPTTDKLPRSEPFEGMAGQSSAILRVFRAIERLRDQEIPVLIRGETGTGKELVARALHRTSSRADGPFLALHCASLPEELFEAELFGYEAGAFTGAEAARPGILESLAGGTLLLDDVPQLSLASQAKLLHALSSGRARRLGGVAQHALDVRILASANVDLELEMARGGFRPDLYFRLRAFEIVIPPLRERKSDVAAIAIHLLDLHAKRLDRPASRLTAEAIALLESHEWPGNVRELESALLRALIHAAPGGPLGARDFTALLPAPSTPAAVPGELLRGRSWEDFRRQMDRAYVAHIFQESKGDLRSVMSGLGIGRTQLYALLRKLGLDPKAMRRGPGEK